MSRVLQILSTAWLAVALAAVGVAVLVLRAGWQSPLMPILMSYCAVCLALTPLRAPPGRPSNHHRHTSV